MHLLSVVAAMTMLSWQANALSTSDLYKMCKPLSDNAFNASIMQDVQCLTYFRAVMDMANYSCDFYNDLLEKFTVPEDQLASVQAPKDLHGAF